MMIYQYAIWAVIGGLSLMLIGGLVLWAYGARPASVAVPGTGIEAESTRVFHTRLARWFFIYGTMALTSGLALLLWAGSVLLKE